LIIPEMKGVCAVLFLRKTWF